MTSLFVLEQGSLANPSPCPHQSSSHPDSGRPGQGKLPGWETLGSSSTGHKHWGVKTGGNIRWTGLLWTYCRSYLWNVQSTTQREQSLLKYAKLILEFVFLLLLSICQYKLGTWFKQLILEHFKHSQFKIQRNLCGHLKVKLQQHKGRIQFKILVVFTTKTEGWGGGEGGPANF